MIWIDRILPATYLNKPLDSMDFKENEALNSVRFGPVEQNHEKSQKYDFIRPFELLELSEPYRIESK